MDNYIDEDSQKKYAINDKSIQKAVEGYDVILPNPIILPEVGLKSVMDQYESGVFLDVAHMEMTLKTIKKLYPETYEDVKEFFEGEKLFLCNMMIMKKELFHEYSKWLFDILSDLEEQIDMTDFSEERRRTLGHIAERLLGAYCFHLKKTRDIKIKYQQMIMFTKPEAETLISPKFDDKNTARIVLSSSLYYSPFCAATIQSIINTSSPKHNYDIVILHTELTQNFKDRFLEMVKGRENFSIRFCDVTRAVYKFELAGREHFSVETYYRLAIGNFLPDYKKVLYLDSDLIVLKDVYELYSTDISGYALAGVVDVCLSGINNGYDPKRADYYRDHAFIQKKNLLKMINAGVLVMNQEYINAAYTTKELLTYAKESSFELCDQDVLNSLFQDKILYLEPNWNTPVYEDETLPAWCTRFAPEYFVKDYKKAAKDPYILHFSSTIKPWNEPGYKQANVFWEVLRQTPFYEFVVHRRIVENASYYAYSVAPAGKVKRQKAPKEKLWRRISNKLMPKGTKRREDFKKFVCFITRKTYVKPYYPVK